MRSLQTVLLCCVAFGSACGPGPVQVLLSGVPAAAQRLELIGQRGEVLAAPLQFSLGSVAQTRREVSLLLALPEPPEDVRLLALVYGSSPPQEDCLLGLDQLTLPAGERSARLDLALVTGCPVRGGDAPRLLRASAPLTRTLAGVTRSSDANLLPADQDHQVTLWGHGFASGAQLLVGDAPAAAAVMTYNLDGLRARPDAPSARFTFRLPRGSGALGRGVRLRVRNPDGQETAADHLLSFYEPRVQLKVVEVQHPITAPYGAYSAPADFVGMDGLPDLVISQPGGFRGWRNTSSGERVTFQDEPALPVFPGATNFREPRSMLIADLDGNARPELIIAYGDRVDSMGKLLTVSRLAILKDLGAGTSWSVTEAPANEDNYFNYLYPADLNGDGRPDLVSIGPTLDNRNLLRTFLNAGDGSFPEARRAACAVEPSRLYQGGDGGNDAASNLTLGDLDGDGALDALIGYARTAAGLVSVRRSISAGCAAPTTYRFQDPSRADLNPGSVPTLGDVNGDGAPDLFLGINDGLTAVRLFLSDGAGRFVVTPSAEGTTIATSDQAKLQITGYPGDLNGDGLADLVILTRQDSDNKAYMYLNQDGTLPRSQAGLPAGGQVIQVPGNISQGATNHFTVRPVIMDINGDGRPDVLLRTNDSEVRIRLVALLNLPSP